ncbi:1873_t:CDS:2 [Entrophospora sp. SA101]|nr:1873_t:CDS:2 [Entrophospora sp. SA101]
MSESTSEKSSKSGRPKNDIWKHFKEADKLNGHYSAKCTRNETLRLICQAALCIWIPVKKTSTNTDILIAQLRAYEAYEYPYDVKFVEGIETPKTWWVGCKQEKNYIQMLSLKILSIIPHNVNCECLFSVLGWFMSKRRTCLNVERLNKMARLHSYYISNGKSLLNYPVDDVDDDKFNEELTEEIDNIEEYEEEEEVIQPGENDITGEGETFDKYFNMNNQDLCELLKIQVSVVIEQREVEVAEIETDEEIDEETILNKHFDLRQN